jgi:hypothetical protein
MANIAFATPRDRTELKKDGFGGLLGYNTIPTPYLNALKEGCGSNMLAQLELLMLCAALDPRYGGNVAGGLEFHLDGTLADPAVSADLAEKEEPKQGGEVKIEIRSELDIALSQRAARAVTVIDKSNNHSNSKQQQQQQQQMLSIPSPSTNNSSGEDSPLSSPSSATSDSSRLSIVSPSSSANNINNNGAAKLSYAGLRKMLWLGSQVKGTKDCRTCDINSALYALKRQTGHFVQAKSRVTMGQGLDPRKIAFYLREKPVPVQWLQLRSSYEPTESEKVEALRLKGWLARQ